MVECGQRLEKVYDDLGELIRQEVNDTAAYRPIMEDAVSRCREYRSYARIGKGMLRDLDKKGKNSSKKDADMK